MIDLRTRNRLRAIRRFARRGAAIVPLLEAEKRPFSKGGVHKPIVGWRACLKFFNQRRRCNWGIATGKASGLIALDIDGEDGHRSLEELQAQFGPLPLTVTVRTGRGYHYLFKAPAGVVRNSAGRLGKGLDVRGDGGYVVGVGSVHPSGKVYSYKKGCDLTSVDFAALPEWLERLLVEQTSDRYVQAAVESEIDRLLKAPLGARNDALNQAAFRLGQLVDSRQQEDAVVQRLENAAGKIGLGKPEILATIRSGWAAGRRTPRQHPSLLSEPSVAESDAEPMTDPLATELAVLGENDVGLADRFVRRHGERTMYTPGRGYLIFDSRRWVSNDLFEANRLAEQTALFIANEPQHLPKEGERAARSRFAQQCQSKSAIDRILETAKSRLAIGDDVLDADHFLLNVMNGTIDLRTGQLREHRPADRITKLAPVSFDPEARCPRFKSYLKKVTDGDKGLALFLQTAIGLTLTGSTEEHCFFVGYGPGRSGKSTLFNVIRDMLGDYGLHTPTETLLVKQHDNNIPNDIARLKGVRMVTALEANWNRQFDEAKLKTMTGGDPLVGRFMRQEYFEFKPAFKLWLGANELPRVRGTSGAFWERVRLIPFNVTIPKEERDPHLVESLKAEWPGILTWAVQGCLRWQEQGLRIPPAVSMATDAWRKRADHLKAFVNEKVIYDQNCVTPSAMFYARYKVYCGERGEEPMSIKALKSKLISDLNFSHARSSKGSGWKGIKLRS